jgi:hypothetical protein
LRLDRESAGVKPGAENHEHRARDTAPPPSGTQRNAAPTGRISRAYRSVPFIMITVVCLAPSIIGLLRADLPVWVRVSQSAGSCVMPVLSIVPADYPQIPAEIGCRPLAILLAEGRAVPARWVRYLQQGEAVLFTFQEHPIEASEDLLRWVRTHVPVETDELVSEVVRADSRLQSLQDVVKALIVNPSTIRWPRDLAVALGLPPGAVRSRIRAAGFQRGAHAIAAVRLGAIEVVRKRMSAPKAQAAKWLGVRDFSNFRRSIRAAIPARREPDPRRLGGN